MGFFNLDKPVLEFSGRSDNAWTIRHAVEGVQIFGGIGSGKTSGSGRMLALKYLSLGFGGLVLTVKPDEKDSWVEYCRLAGRENDLVILEPGGAYHFNFLEYEAIQATGQGAMTENIVEVLKTVIRAGEEKESGKKDDAFWESALDMLIFNVIDLCRMAYGTLSLKKMYDIVQTILKPGESFVPEEKAEEAKAFQKAMTLAQQHMEAKVNAWLDTLSLGELHQMTNRKFMQERAEETVPEARLFSFLTQFFLDTFKSIGDKTRSIIEFSFSGFLFRLLREPVYSLLCNGASNIRPEDSLEGKIILLNLPVKLYHKVGRDCQVLFKYIWQRTMEKRNITQNERPVFLWADEAQNFIHEHDASFQATARSSRVATVYLTQNLPNYYAMMGGDKAEYRVKSFMGTLATKIFHANADIETNKYASELIGEDYVETLQRGASTGEKMSTTHTTAFQLEKLIRPEKFVSLRTGGPLHKFVVEAILHRQGDAIEGSHNFTKLRFNQHYKP